MRLDATAERKRLIAQASTPLDKDRPAHRRVDSGPPTNNGGVYGLLLGGAGESPRNRAYSV